MKYGPYRFEHFLLKLEEQMEQAAKELNPALWLYRNDARTTLFMLEGLCRIYAKLHNANRFEKLKDYFKTLEDGLGTIDYYDAYGKELSEAGGIPPQVIDYQFGQMREKVQRVNDLLENEGWTTDDFARIKKIRKKLRNADWISAKDEAKGVKKMYEESILKIRAFVSKAKGAMTEMESQVHELRREIRWLSIYPHALLGMIQLTESGESSAAVEQYQTPEVLASKFNVMPGAGTNTWFLMLEKKHFMAMSWVIAELGKIKDQALKVFAVAEALEQTENQSHEAAYANAFGLLHLPDDSMKNWLKQSSTILNDFTREEILSRMVYCLAHTPDDVK